MDAGNCTAGGQAECVYRHLHTPSMAVSDFNIAVDDHVFSNKPHGPHANGIAKLLQVIFKLGDAGVAVAIANCTKACGTLAEHHAGILCPAKPNANDGRLAG